MRQRLLASLLALGWAACGPEDEGAARAPPREVAVEVEAATMEVEEPLPALEPELLLEALDRERAQVVEVHLQPLEERVFYRVDVRGPPPSLPPPPCPRCR